MSTFIYQRERTGGCGAEGREGIAHGGSTQSIRIFIQRRKEEGGGEKSGEVYSNIRRCARALRRSATPPPRQRRRLLLFTKEKTVINPLAA